MALIEFAMTMPGACRPRSARSSGTYNQPVQWVPWLGKVTSLLIDILLRVDFVQHPGVGDGLAQVGHAAHPGDHTLHAHAEPRVRHGAVAPQVDVPLERFPRQV